MCAPILKSVGKKILKSFGKKKILKSVGKIAQMNSGAPQKEEAVAACRDWIKVDPQNAKAHRNLVALLGKVGNKGVGSSLEVSWTIY